MLETTLGGQGLKREPSEAAGEGGRGHLGMWGRGWAGLGSDQEMASWTSREEK